MPDMQGFTFQIFALYAALNAFIMLILGILVVRARFRTRTVIGDGGIAEMAGPLRAHANNAEYVPMAILLMWTMVPLGASVWLLHATGISLTLGRLIHGFALSRNVGPSIGRQIGMTLTWLTYVIAIVGVAYLAITSMMAASSPY